MKSSSILRASTRFRLCLPIILTLSVLHPFCKAATPPPVPAVFQDLYTELDNYLTSFNATLNSSWNGSKYPVLYTANSLVANGNAGPQVVNPLDFKEVQLELQGFKAMGYQAVMIELPFPMLYEPFFSSQAQYQQYVNFYTQVASTIRGLGMKIVIENDAMFPTGSVYSGWSVAPFYATLDWTQYQQARAQTAKTVAQIMQPDYMVLMEEPDTESMNSGQTEVNTVAGATSMVSQILTSVREAGIPGMKVGAGMGSWYPQHLALTQSLAALPLDFIDMHIYLINNGYLNNALTIATTAAAAGKPVAMTECWLYKSRDSEVSSLSYDYIYARNPFDFWEPLDTYFLKIMKKLGNYSRMYFWSPFSTFNFRGNLPYDSSTENLTPMEIKSTWAPVGGGRYAERDFTPTGLNSYNMLVSPPNTIPPTTPSNLNGGSGAPTTAGVNWSASTDNVGVAGYNVFRNGVQIGTTAGTSYQDSGLTQATTYTYMVSAFDLAGNTSSPSQSVPVTTKDVTPPSTPANLAASVVSSKQINLTWSPSTDLEAVAGYTVFRGTTPAGLSQVGRTAASTSPSFISYPLTPGTTYYFGVEAVDTSGNISAMSAVVSATTLAPPAAPVSLVATPASPKKIGLTWTAGTSGMPIASYSIYRGTSPSSLSQVGVTKELSYMNYALTPATTYYYAVQAEDTGGDLSPLSAAVAATTLALPAAPASLVATPASPKKIGLTWTAGTSGMPIASYAIYRGTSRSSLSQVGVTKKLSYTDYPLTPATKYYYAVQAEDTGGDLSPLSATVAATTLALPKAPKNPVVTPVAREKIVLTWTAGASSMPIATYDIYRGTSPSSLSQVGVSKKLSYTDYPLTPATTYYYAVQAEDSGGDFSPLSATVSATTP